MVNLKKIIRKLKNKESDKKQSFDQPSQIKIGKFNDFDIAYRKGTADEGAIDENIIQDIFFSALPEYKSEPNHTIIDIGAHIGTFSLLSSKKSPKGKIFAIEACEDTFTVLRINAALNKCDNIVLVQKAISGENGTCTLYYEPARGNWQHSTVAELSEYSEEVEAITLQDFIKEQKISFCDFMKLNCEGAEFPILLKTPVDVLKKKFGVLLVLYHCDLWGKNTEEDLIAHLEKADFKCELRHKSRKRRRGWLVAVNNSVK